ncbi:RluA family pseudouridine synthase [Sphingomonas yantingensis]|uniref:Pseudouridine synthase n=1 Tax=Sphingomonas yantingensis TaxID=1241761 RepID=A0A7W9AN87_9SPHN|nr:RluA family pseudouridine synthase [Sphingomonas yantingensis]MBB5697563.1 23S rRNA pseudouridine1911/1915/1917 synthase [Sphingomonas yantingensis]
MDRGVSTIEATISPAADGWRLDRALAEAVPTLSRERLKVLIASGAVVGDAGPVRDPARKATAGAQFQVNVPEPKPAHNEAQAIDLTIAYEDEHLIVVDKPAGLVVHPAAGNLDGTMVNALLHHCAGQLSGIGGVARPGIVHRIDKDTSGLIVAAKHDRAHEGLARQFKAHSIDRRYLAIVAGRPLTGSGRVEARLGRSSADRKKMAVVGGEAGRHAITHWRLLDPLREAALVECRLETGRTHQVRVHMASIGHPLLGDPVYGRSKAVHRPILETLGFRRQALHATRLGFIHPVTGHALSFDSAMPDDMQELFNRLVV